MPQSLPAFSPDFAVPGHGLLWNGTGMGADTLVATPGGPVAAGRLQRGGSVLGSAGQPLVLSEVNHLALPVAAFRRLGLAPPLRIAPGALGLGMPTGPLLLGPAQRIRLEGGWVAADLLADGLGVHRIEDDVQMVLLAHGSETPLRAEGLLLAPAPIGNALHAGTDTEAVVACLLRQAASSGVPDGRLVGYVDQADRHGGTGWALDIAAPQRVVPLDVVVAGSVVARVLADRPRPDLVHPDLRPGTGPARHGFAWRFDPPLPPGRTWLVELRRAGGGATLPGTPLLFDQAGTTPVRFDTALAGLGDGTDEVRFLAQLLERAASTRPR